MDKSLPRRVLQQGAYQLAVLCTLLAGACGSGETQNRSCDTQVAALHNGSPDPAALELSVEQRHAVTRIEANAGLLICSGTLIAPGWVLTAAHCAVSDSLAVRVHGRSLPQRSNNYFIHPKLDAMLIALDETELGSLASVPIIPWSGTLDSNWVGRRVTLAGVGVTETGVAGELRFVEESIVEVKATEVWVDGQGQTGACAGDSGGPLLVADGSGRARVIGVLDRGSANCRGMDVYTRIDTLLNWIEQSSGIAAGSNAGDSCN